MDTITTYPDSSEPDSSFRSGRWAPRYRACVVCTALVVISGAIASSLGTYRLLGKPLEPLQATSNNGATAEPSNREGGDVTTCTDEDCRSLSRYIETSLQESDPCENFYAYVCSNWSYTAKPGIRQSAFVSESALRAADLERVLTNELLAGTGDVSLSPFFDVWNWCRNLSSATAEPTAPFLKILYTLGLSQFPLASEGGRLAAATGKVFRITGLAPLIKVSLDPVDKVIRLDRPDTLFPDFTVVSNGHRAWYLESIRRAARRAYPELFRFEQDLVTAMNSPDPGDNYSTVPVFRLLDAPGWSWEEFLANAFHGILPIKRTTKVKLQLNRFQTKFLQLLDDHRSEDTINYLGFRVYLAYAPLLYGKRFSQLVDVAVARRPGWEWGRTRDRTSACTRAVSRADPALATAVLSHRVKNDYAEPILRSMLEHSKKDIVQFLGEMAWVTALFLDRLSRRYRKIRPVFFLPTDWRKYDFRLDQCRSFRCDAADLPLLEVFQRIIAERQKRRFQNLKKPFPDYPSDVFQTECALEGDLIFVPFAAVSSEYHHDAFWGYHLPRMLIVFSTVLLDVFRQTVFEVRNRYVDLHERFAATEDCLRLQYAAMVEQLPLPLSSNATSASDLLDFMAVQASFRTYRQFASSDVEVTLPGLPFGSDQLFFIHFALSRCEKYDAKYEEQLLRHGRRAPAPFRVNGPLRNFKAFSKAFHCRPQTYMNPRKKCIF